MNDIQIHIPSNLETMQLPSPELLQYYQDLEDRVVWIDYEINEMVLDVTKKILCWNKMDSGTPSNERKPIKLLIFSIGGDLDLTLGLMNVIELSKTPVYGINMGQALSGGLYILLSCHKRYCLKDSTAILHKGGGTFAGTSIQVENNVAYYKAQLARLKEIVLGKTSIDNRTYNKKQDEDWYLGADDQVKYGIAEMINKIEDVIA